MPNSVPLESYGVKKQTTWEDKLGMHLEELSRNGYTVVKGAISSRKLKKLRDQVAITRQKYTELHGYYFLQQKNEEHTIRAPFNMFQDEVFSELFSNNYLLNLLTEFLEGPITLLQQNIIINPPHKGYGAGRWHRDLPYQHFTSSKPLAANALLAIDDLHQQNGATWVLPNSHKHEKFPSQHFLKKNAVQISAPAGSFIILDAMLFHSGGANNSADERVAINHVYGIPLFAQQIKFSKETSNTKINSLTQSRGLGHNNATEYLAER